MIDNPDKKRHDYRIIQTAYIDCSVQKIVYPLRIWMKFWQQNLGEVKVCRP